MFYILINFIPVVNSTATHTVTNRFQVDLNVSQSLLEMENYLVWKFSTLFLHIAGHIFIFTQRWAMIKTKKTKSVLWSVSGILTTKITTKDAKKRKEYIDVWKKTSTYDMFSLGSHIESPNSKIRHVRETSTFSVSGHSAIKTIARKL